MSIFAAGLLIAGGFGFIALVLALGHAWPIVVAMAVFGCICGLGLAINHLSDRRPTE